MQFFDEREQVALDEYCGHAEMSEELALRRAFRLFHDVQKYLVQGMELCFRKPDGEIVRPFYFSKLEPFNDQDSQHNQG
jgi:hypothetical protein